MEIKDIHKLFLQCKSVSIDTRKIEKNSMFIAIKGERFDANTFANEALEKGASYVIIDNRDYYIDQRTILTENSLETLQELAKFHRDYLKLPIIALTGSNGKTTTKELINVVLSKSYEAKATIGNLNNHIGVPLTLLSFNSETEIGIVEMGANHQKEIEFLCSIAKPDFGYITNFGKAHLEGFGGFEGVIKGKSEMYTYLSENKKIAFVNLDDPIQIEKTEGIERYTFGSKSKDTNVVVDSIKANPFVSIKTQGIEITSHLIGIYNANNINAAVTIGTYFKVDMDDIKEAIENYIPENNRSQLLKKNSNDIILDAYNANPSSMTVALENFMQLEIPKKVAILGDMFELGNESLEEHKSIIALASKDKNTTFYFIGKDFYANKIENKNMFFFETFEGLANELTQNKIENTTILIKGSRGMALERSLDFLP
ncbi:UDP-N-acetylmuramoyl-tripeptide--D-alanyl-D-alanine ligase [Flavobacterium arsenatis]|uniref:UDP-N-acetylmuramoyl-tripeptide--D-alanyl-D-alanine ligase n=1 Tax=Flavobacterium arsenatis TaxID=1484332 RepID=A0ABU1TJZ9_9FLAO|nr:UDP-N-acetylmuramoyl-tripeptide--D-alanyl-D-alanine ligase [Flavobacterium arsenatis]MDR6966310.1 UDP-N-acetylmuramoyl-tripeptide--D-alanyl-D-alanine ligase [Flavobacterium arsenatis]